MAFVKCKTLRNEPLTVEGIACSVDAHGVAEVPDALAERLVSSIPSEFQLTGNAAHGAVESMAGLRKRCADLERHAEIARTEGHRERAELQSKLEAAEFHLADREEKLADCQRRLAEAEAELQLMPALRRDLAAAQEQVQLLLKQAADGRKGKGKAATEAGAAEAVAVESQNDSIPAEPGRKGKNR